jgi:hypothetical protein
MSHPDCHTAAGHVCQRPSGQPCIEPGCDRPAGTLWGPLWCPEDDEKRLDRISASFEKIAASFGTEG